MKLEEKVNVIIRYVLAETEEEKEKAMDLLKANGSELSIESAEEQIENILCEIGFPENNKGYQYSFYAIEVAVDNPDIINSITKKLYPAVAEKFNTTWSRAEKAMRYGIECAWDRCDPNIVEKYFGSTISAYRGKPTNSEFIARIANIVRRRIGNA